MIISNVPFFDPLALPCHFLLECARSSTRPKTQAERKHKHTQRLGQIIVWDVLRDQNPTVRVIVQQSVNNEVVRSRSSSLLEYAEYQSSRWWPTTGILLRLARRGATTPRLEISREGISRARFVVVALLSPARCPFPRLGRFVRRRRSPCGRDASRQLCGMTVPIIDSRPRGQGSRR